MRSIRLSLILCILVLLTLSLLTVSALAYREAEISLGAKKESMREFLTAQHKEQRHREIAKLDKSLLDDARVLAKSVTAKWELYDRKWGAINSLGLLIAATSPEAAITAYPWIVEGHPKFWNRFMEWSGSQWKGSWKIHELRMTPEEVDNPSKFFQINTVTGDELRSHSMGDYSFPFEQEWFSGNNAAYVEEKFDNVAIGPTLKVRVVRAKYNRLAISWFPKTNVKTSTSGAEKPPAQPAFQLPPELSIFVHVASDLAPLDATLAGLKRKLHEDLAQLEESSQDNLLALRNNFLLIGGLTLLGAVFAGFLVVRWGLSPVRRLSDAVSRVSEKDFRLPLDEKQLPSELRPIAERLTQTLDLLQRAFDREKQAAADISHELRTPLAAMMATLDVTLRKPRAAEEYHEVLLECRESGLQMTQLVERLLALARLDAGADHLRPRQVDMAQLADQCSAMVRPLAEARGVQLNVEHNGPACLQADPDKLREVLTNLLHNAIEYNKPDGRIDVSVQRSNGDLELRVKDTGVGIAPEAREHIFERFYRADASRHVNEGVHAGIGLALVKGYVDLMGGRIDLDSAVGVGTTFTIRLPVHEENEA